MLLLKKLSSDVKAKVMLFFVFFLDSRSHVSVH